LSIPDDDIDAFAIVGNLIARLPIEPDGDVMAVLIEDDELAAYCRQYLLAPGVQTFEDWGALQAEMKGRLGASR
jgi:hypothetical protein